MAIQPDRLFHTREELEAHIAVALAGRAGEELVFGTHQVTTGASNDLQRATELVSRMCFEWGMDASMGRVARAPSAEMAVSEREQSIVCDNLAALYTRTLELLEKHRAKLMAIAQALETQELLTGDAVQALAGTA